MSSPASRQRQRHRRRARQRLGEAQQALAERKVDLASYERVIADMNRRYRAGQMPLFSGGQTITLVETLRDAARSECEKLAGTLKDLETACAKLEPQGASAA